MLVIGSAPVELAIAVGEYVGQTASETEADFLAVSLSPAACKV